jgi:hypothetical protein
VGSHVCRLRPSSCASDANSGVTSSLSFRVLTRSRTSATQRSCAVSALIALAAMLSACASPVGAPSAPPAAKSFVHVTLTGPLPGRFATCTSRAEGPGFLTDLVGMVMDASGKPVGSSDFGLISGGRLVAGQYVLRTDKAPPTGFRAVGTLTVTPQAGEQLPPVTNGQKYEGSSQATFLTHSGSLTVSSDGAVAIQTDLIDLQATQQTPNHPVISGSWRCGTG